MDHRHGRFRCALRRVTRAAVVETGGGGDGERGRWRRGISSSSAPTVVETPATNPVFRIEDYELEGRSARNLKARPAMHRTGCPGRRERTLRVPGGRSRSRNEGGLRAPADAGGVPEVAVRSAGGVRPGVRGGDDPASPREGRGGSGAADRARQIGRGRDDGTPATCWWRRPESPTPACRTRSGGSSSPRRPRSRPWKRRRATVAAEFDAAPARFRPGRVAPRRQSPARGAEVSGVGDDLSSNSTTRNCREGATARRATGSGGRHRADPAASGRQSRSDGTRNREPRRPEPPAPREAMTAMASISIRQPEPGGSAPVPLPCSGRAAPGAARAPGAGDDGGVRLDEDARDREAPLPDAPPGRAFQRENGVARSTPQPRAGARGERPPGSSATAPIPGLAGPGPQAPARQPPRRRPPRNAGPDARAPGRPQEPATAMASISTTKPEPGRLRGSMVVRAGRWSPKWRT